MGTKGVVLEAKVRPPKLIRNLVVRRALEEQVDAADEKLLVFQATMGFGKTVFVNAYGKRGWRAQAWYHTGSLDNDLMVFAEYLAASVRVVWPWFDFAPGGVQLQKDAAAQAKQLAQGFAAALAEAQREAERVARQEDGLGRGAEGAPETERPGSAEARSEMPEARRKAAEAGKSAEAGEESAPDGRAGALDLVLDDFQEISQEEILLFADRLVEYLPERMRLLLTLKSAVPRFAVKYTLSGDARVFDAQDLAFSRGEVGELFARLNGSAAAAASGRASGARSKPADGCALPPGYGGRAADADGRAAEETAAASVRETTEAIYNYSEGWPAGVMFLCLFIGKRRIEIDLDGMEGVMRESMMYNFIMYELFRKLSFDIQRFLTRTAPLEYLTPKLCRAVSGVQDAAAILDYLIQEGLFIQKVEGRALAYRYHSLFRNFLLSQLGGEERREILDKAAACLLNTEQKEQAAVYAMESGNRELVLLALESTGIELLREGRMNTLESWLRFAEGSKEPWPPRALTAAGFYCLWAGKLEQGLKLLARSMDRALEQGEERLFLSCVQTAVRHLWREQRFREAGNVLRRAKRGYTAHFTGWRFPLQELEVWSCLFCGREQTAAGLCAAVADGSAALRMLGRILASGTGARGEALARLKELEGTLAGNGGAALFAAPGEAARAGAAEADAGDGKAGAASLACGREALNAGEVLPAVENGALLAALCGYHILLLEPQERFAEQDAARLSLVTELLDGTPYAGCARLLAAVRMFRDGRRREAVRCVAPAVQSLGNTGTGELQLPGRTVAFCRDIAVIGEERLADGTEGVHLLVSVFGDFGIHVVETGEELHWRTRKAQECLAWLFHVRGRKVSREELLRALWDVEELPANEVAALHNILSSIRRTLKPFGLENLIQYQDRLYYLQEDAVPGERDQIDRLCSVIEAGDAGTVCNQAQWLLQLAEHPYLQNVEGRWCEAARYQYENMFLKGLQLAADTYAERGIGEEAVRCYLAAWKLNPYDEKLPARALACASRFSTARDVRRLYEDLCHHLCEETGEEPGAALREAFQEALARCEA